MKRLVGGIALVVVALCGSAQFAGPLAGQFSDAGGDVPAYHANAPRASLPPVLNDVQLNSQGLSHPYQKATYAMAAKVPGVFYQEPCYCHCDRAMGHQSLHSCFEGTHGAECSTCMKEAAYSYRETQRGRTPAQIRAGIERGDYETLNLDGLR